MLPYTRPSVLVRALVRKSTVNSYTRPCKSQLVRKSLSLRDERWVCLVRQLVRAKKTADVTDGGLEDAVVDSIVSESWRAARAKQSTNLTVLPEWSRVKSTVAVWLTACSRRSYTFHMSDLFLPALYCNCGGRTVSPIIACRNGVNGRRLFDDCVRRLTSVESASTSDAPQPFRPSVQLFEIGVRSSWG